LLDLYTPTIKESQISTMQVVTIKAAAREHDANSNAPVSLDQHSKTSAPTAGGCPFSGSAGSDSLPQQSFPFSRGDRNCVGRALAKMEMTIILAKLLSSYDVVLAEDLVSAEDVRASAAYKVTWCPQKLPMRLVPW
jgi:hypothetical protein